MVATEDIIRGVVAQVLSRMKGAPPSSNGSAPVGQLRGVFADVDAAARAAVAAQREFERRSIAERKKALDCIRKICVERAEELGREELEETKIGKLAHKIEKLT